MDRMFYHLDGTMVKSGWSCGKLAQMATQEIEGRKNNSVLISKSLFL